MPPEWLKNFQGFMGSFMDREINRYANAPERVGDPSGQPLSGKDLLANFMRGAEPLPFINTLSPDPEVESLPIQILASFLVPGIPGGPIFNKADDLLKGLGKVTTEFLLKFKKNAGDSLFDEMMRLGNGSVGTASGSVLENRSIIELDVINDATDLEIIRRAKLGDVEAKNKLVDELIYDIPDVAPNMDQAQLNKYFDEWENNAKRRITVWEHFLDNTEGLGFVAPKKPDDVLGEFFSSAEFDNMLLHQGAGTLYQLGSTTFDGIRQSREQEQRSR